MSREGEQGISIRLVHLCEEASIKHNTGKPRQHGINNWEVFKAQIGKKAVQQSLERISEVAQCMCLSSKRKLAAIG